MSAPLSHNQKRYLSQLSDRAFDHCSAEADSQYFYDDLPATKARDHFRHDQVVKACAKIGLRCCSQDDYKLVEAHFLNLLGETGKAMNALLAAQTEARRTVLAKIGEACRQFGFNLSYAESICRQRAAGLGLDQADVKKLWTTFYTVRNRGLARRRSASAGNYSEPQTQERKAA